MITSHLSNGLVMITSPLVIITKTLHRHYKGHYKGCYTADSTRYYNTQDDTNSTMLMMQHASHTKSFMREIYEGDGTSPRP